MFIKFKYGISVGQAVKVIIGEPTIETIYPSSNKMEELWSW